jgi:hypothetical protein
MLDRVVENEVASRARLIAVSDTCHGSSDVRLLDAHLLLAVRLKILSDISNSSF